MKWFVLCLILCSNIVNADSFTKSSFFIEVDTKTKESLQYYSIMGSKPNKITSLTKDDFMILSGQHLTREESLRDYGMCDLGYKPLVFYTNIEYISILRNTVVFYIAYYAKCFNEFDITEQEKMSGVLNK
jgi:hypothetical protein